MVWTLTVYLFGIVTGAVAYPIVQSLVKKAKDKVDGL